MSASLGTLREMDASNQAVLSGLVDRLDLGVRIQLAVKIANV